VGERVVISNEVNLVKRFGAPTNYNAETFFSGASFLAYGNNLQVSRAANTIGTSPVITADIQAANVTTTLSSGNTAGLVAGMTLIGSSNTAVISVGTIDSVVNTTAFVFTSADDVVGSGSGVTLQFVPNTTFSAIANTAQVDNLTAQIVNNQADFDANYGTYDSNVPFIARCPGGLGNSLRVSVCANTQGFSQEINLASSTYGTNTSFTVIPNSNT